MADDFVVCEARVLSKVSLCVERCVVTSLCPCVFQGLKRDFLFATRGSEERDGEAQGKSEERRVGFHDESKVWLS